MARTVLAAILLVFLLPTLVVANASTWALRTVLNDRAFATTVGRVMDAPAVESRMAMVVGDVVVSRMDALDPRIVEAGGLAVGLAADAGPAEIRAWIDARVLDALRSPEVEAARDRLVMQLHRWLVGAAEGSGPVAIRGDALVMDVGEVYDTAIARIDPDASTFLGSAAGQSDVVLARAAEIAAVRQTLSTLEAVQVIIPLVVLAVVLLILVLAHRRVRALAIVGVAVMIAGLVSLAAAWLGGAVVAGIPSDPTASDVAREVYDAFVGLLVGQSLLLLLGGFVIALVAWIALRRRDGRVTSA